VLSTIFSMLAAAAEHGADEEVSKTPFFVLGGLLAAWAVILAGVGLTRPEFPGRNGITAAVCALSVVLTAGAIGSAVVTA